VSKDISVSDAKIIYVVKSRTSRVWADLPVAMEWPAAGEQVEDYRQIADNDQSVADVDADLIVPSQACLLS